MTHERCPTFGQTVQVTAVCDPSAITISPCGHKIGHMMALIDTLALDSLSPGEWLTEFFAALDDN